MLVSDLILDKSLGATTGTVYVYASGSVAPGQVQVSKSGTYANSVNISVGSFSSFTGMAGYSWRAAISISANGSAGWPSGSNSVVNLVVKTAGGIQIGVVNITLVILSEWYILPPNEAVIKRSDPEPYHVFYLYCLHSFDSGSIYIEVGWPECISYYPADYTRSDLPFYAYRCAIGAEVYNWGVNAFDHSVVRYPGFSGSVIAYVSVDMKYYA